MVKEALSFKERVGLYLGLIVLMFAGFTFGLALNAIVQVFMAGADLFRSPEPWAYMGWSWILIGIAMLIGALSKKDPEKRSMGIVRAGTPFGLGLGHFLLIWISQWLHSAFL